MIELDQSRWTPEEREQLRVRGWRDRRPGETPLVTAISRPADYVDDFHRGTVEFDATKTRNYAFHNVTIPAGTKVAHCNFVQAQPGTAAITAGAGVEFAECNLTNCVPAGKLERCNNAQAWMIPTEEKMTRQYICARHEDLKGDEIAPVGAITVK